MELTIKVRDEFVLFFWEDAQSEDKITNVSPKGFINLQTNFLSKNKITIFSLEQFGKVYEILK